MLFKKISCLVFIFLFGNNTYALADGQVTFKTSIISKHSQLIFPVPRSLVPDDSNIELFEGDIPIDIKYKALTFWPTLTKSKFVRLLLIDVKHVPGKDIFLTIKWGQERSNKHSQILKINDKAKLIYPSKNWLAESLLLHPQVNNLSAEWYIEPQVLYANYVTNKKLLFDKGYPPKKAAQWLFDRPQAIYQLFIMSGEIKWFNEANILVDYYINNIDEQGGFKLINKKDTKFLMPKGLLYKYLLSGDQKAKDSLKRIFDSSLKWEPSYSFGKGFWTERHQAAALNTAISYWESSNDPVALARINEIIDATVDMTFNPVNDWLLRGCPQHTFVSHEGVGDNSATCSPWMMALLSDALWRFYRLTDDVRAAALIDAFGDFILNHGLFWGDDRVKNIIIPKYIVSLENSRQEELNQWTDPQHTCDVAGLIGKSVFVKKVNKREDFLLTKLFSVFIDRCKSDYMRIKNMKQKPAYWVAQPPRRFGWTYSTTSDLPWLEDFLLVKP